MPDIAAWKITSSGIKNILQSDEFNFIPLSLDGLSQSMPIGAYTTFRTYDHNKALNLEAHIDRLEETSIIMKSPVVIDRTQLHDALRKTIFEFSHQEARVRITLDLTENIGEIYISLEPLHLPPVTAYQDGVRTATRCLNRNQPKAKMTDFIKTASIERKRVNQGVYEIFMFNEDGYILEGLTSNFFAVKNGTIWTSDQGILPGLTRQMVIEQAELAEYPVVYQSIHKNEIGQLQEAFLTSSSRAIVPVVEIDGVKIGDGKPGSVARTLLKRFEEKIESMVKPI